MQFDLLICNIRSRLLVAQCKSKLNNSLLISSLNRNFEKQCVISSLSYYRHKFWNSHQLGKQLLMGGSPGELSKELILQPFRCFTYVTAHSPTFPALHLRHSSFSNPFVALPMSQLILQPFRCFNYVTVHSLTLLSFLLRILIKSLQLTLWFPQHWH